MTIVEFLEARLAYDEHLCAVTAGGAFLVVTVDGSAAADVESVRQYYHRFQPEWMVLDLAAKRAILEMHAGPHECPSAEDNCGWWIDEQDPCPTMRVLAAVYRDHSDYRNLAIPADTDKAG